jgi:NADH dehydrogenase (ubiquinone) 1 alpha subcomplex subunit 8
MHGLEREPGRSGETGANYITLHRIEDVNKHCLAEFRRHWTCLDNNNQQLWQCRPQEWKLNKCVFDNLVRSTTWYNTLVQLLILVQQKIEKVIPDTPAGETPVHLRKRQIYSQNGP